MSKSKSEITQKIEQEHHHLKQDMSSLEDQVNKDVSPEHFLPWKIMIMGKLRDFQNHLAKHFDLEEEGGFMEEILKLAPQHQDKIDQLEHEHENIIKKLGVVIGNLKQLSEEDFGKLTGIKERILGIFTDLHSHEAIERELLQDAYLQDSGLGD